MWQAGKAAPQERGQRHTCRRALTQPPLADLTLSEWDVLFPSSPPMLSPPYPSLSRKYPASSRKLWEKLSDASHGCGCSFCLTHQGDSLLVSGHCHRERRLPFPPHMDRNCRNVFLVPRYCLSLGSAMSRWVSIMTVASGRGLDFLALGVVTCSR